MNRDEQTTRVVSHTPRWQLVHQLRELEAIKSWLENDPALHLQWQGSYYEGDEGLKEQMANLANYHANRAIARKYVLNRVNDIIAIVKNAID